ncbi:type IX secretion system membrane protein, PorP/SprF family [Daejeonella rubra]|uniref:Type IX secretion system membrane protein, PorP/SprF family n=1 Tax=Daejeonella rubra TaxID=990371 RepID=A0A1G9XG50_9SPHI|nr:type IX secretion system membrane protein PorP/SprF [Daejeonella rubra]SDM95779.1 type IX secretion system membrane protein, PorP/SprF family [Daejeonella rubra]
MNNKTYLLALFMLLTALPSMLCAQQLPLYSQYMFNTLEINPAYAGFKQSMQFTSVFRKQFNGIKDSPQTAMISGDMPIGDTKLGVGLKIVDDRISVTQNFGAQLAMSYRIEGENSNLSFGLQAGALNYKTDFSKLNITNAGDPVFAQNLNAMAANFGTGMFFNTSKFYAGLSSPNLVRAHLRKTDVALSEYTVKQSLHVYLNAGYLITLNDNFVLKPSFLLRGVKGIPLNYDINANLFFREIMSGGVSYRNNSALVGLLDFRLIPTLRLGYAYDYNLGRINNFAKATHEIILRFHIPIDKDELMPSYMF